MDERAVRLLARRQRTPSVTQALRDGEKHARRGDEGYTFSLFWAVERTNDSSEANLHLEYPKMEVEASVVLPNGRKAVQADAMHAAALVPPVLTNQARVGQHTRLVAINDLNLQKIDEEKEQKRREGKEQKRRQEKADAAASAAKKARVQ